jgi:hypothetical protein
MHSPAAISKTPLTRELGAASSVGALQGAGHETPAHRRRDAREPGLAVAVVRLALLPGARPSGKPCCAGTEQAGVYSGAASQDRDARPFRWDCVN